MSAPYSRLALASSFDGSTRCGAPRSWTYTSIAGILPKDRADSACVVEMDVRQQHLMDVADSDAPVRERRAQAREGRRRTGIHERDAGRTLEDRGRDDLGVSEEVQIDEIEVSSSGHGRGRDRRRIRNAAAGSGRILHQGW